MLPLPMPSAINAVIRHSIRLGIIGQYYSTTRDNHKKVFRGSDKQLLVDVMRHLGSNKIHLCHDGGSMKHGRVVLSMVGLCGVWWGCTAYGRIVRNMVG